MSPRFSSDPSVISASSASDEPWEVGMRVAALSKAGDHDAAIELGRRALEGHPDTPVLSNHLAWALYRRDLAGLEPGAELSRRRAGHRALEEIRGLTAADPYGDYSPLALATFRFARCLMGRFADAALDQLDTLDPDLLPARGSGGYPSELSTWFRLRTKALYQLGRWDELLAECDRALASDGVDDDDRHWIEYRLGVAAVELGRLEQGLRALDEVGSRRDEWYVAQRRARALRELGRTSDAQAVVAPWLQKLARDAKAAALFVEAAECFAATDEPAAEVAVQVARHLRASQGWPDDPAVDRLTARLGLDPGGTDRPDLGPLLQACERVLAARRSAGVVARTVPDRGFGFITPDHGGEDVFFHVSDVATGTLPEQGVAVSYRAVPSVDRSTGERSTKAVEVEPDRICPSGLL